MQRLDVLENVIENIEENLNDFIDNIEQIGRETSNVRASLDIFMLLDQLDAKTMQLNNEI